MAARDMRRRALLSPLCIPKRRQGFEKFSDRARKVVNLARDEAENLRKARAHRFGGGKAA